MKFVILIHASIIALSSAYQFNFQVKLTTPKESKCSLDPERLKYALGKTMESGGNQYLQDNGFPGIFTDVKIFEGDYFRQLTEIESDMKSEDFVDASHYTKQHSSQRRVESTHMKDNEEIILFNDSMETEHRHLSFTWGGNGICRGCPIDNGDGRRALRGLQFDSKGTAFSKRSVQAYVNQGLKVELPDIVEEFEDESECSDDDDDSEWIAEFIFL